MSFCEICGMEADTLYVCSRCGARFCDECGDLKRKLCYDCLRWEDDDEEGAWEEEEGWFEEEGWGEEEEWDEEDWDDEDSDWP